MVCQRSPRCAFQDPCYSPLVEALSSGDSLRLPLAVGPVTIGNRQGIAKSLIEAGADVNARMVSGLHWLPCQCSSCHLIGYYTVMVEDLEWERTVTLPLSLSSSSLELSPEVSACDV
jgi:hypothetical protein